VNAVLSPGPATRVPRHVLVLVALVVVMLGFAIGGALRAAVAYGSPGGGAPSATPHSRPAATAHAVRPAKKPAASSSQRSVG
jgi:hypothetical protein